jgi:hypothetical protein
MHLQGSIGLIEQGNTRLELLAGLLQLDHQTIQYVHLCFFLLWMLCLIVVFVFAFAVTVAIVVAE